MRGKRKSIAPARRSQAQRRRLYDRLPCSRRNTGSIAHTMIPRPPKRQKSHRRDPKRETGGKNGQVFLGVMLALQWKMRKSTARLRIENRLKFDRIPLGYSRQSQTTVLFIILLPSGNTLDSSCAPSTVSAVSPSHSAGIEPLMANRFGCAAPQRAGSGCLSV